MKLIDVVQRLKLVSDYDQCRKAMDDAIDEITKLREQVTAYDKWLSEGVYFTTDEYIAECRRVNKELALRDLENMKLREALCKATRSLYGMQVPKYYSDLIDETFTPTHLQEWYADMVGEPVCSLGAFDYINWHTKQSDMVLGAKLYEAKGFIA